jgi:hypothetical protein
MSKEKPKKLSRHNTISIYIRLTAWHYKFYVFFCLVKLLFLHHPMVGYKKECDKKSFAAGTTNVSNREKSDAYRAANLKPEGTWS